MQSDCGNYTGMALLDLQKAFDTVDHKILLDKLHAMGVSDTSVGWFRSYLCGRSQFVCINGTNSDFLPIVCGVPQGSILGPLLFLAYVNDMESSVTCKLLLYADDSALLISGKSIGVIEQLLTDELNKVHEWLIDNKLSIHLGKTEVILYGPPRKSKGKILNVTCGNIAIGCKDSVTYLGAELDRKLSGELMANKILKKVNSRLKFLYRKSKFLNMKTRQMLVSALVQCHFDYACSFWFKSITQLTRTKLVRSQNKAIRFILNKNYCDHVSAEDYQLAGFLPLHYRVDFLMLSHMFKINTLLAPSYLIENFKLISHNYNTRSYKNYELAVLGSQGQATFKYNGVILWRNIDNDTKDSQNIVNFKKSIKQYMWKKVFEKEQSVSY